MLQVILLILKILGIILLGILVLLLLSLYAVFFMPLSYRIQLRNEEEFQVSAFGSWCFRILTVRWQQNRETGWMPKVIIRLFGFALWMNYEEPGSKGKRAGRGLTRRLKKWWRQRRSRKKRKAAPPDRQEEPPESLPEPEVSAEPEILDRAEEKIDPEKAEEPAGRDAAEERTGSGQAGREKKRSSFPEKVVRVVRRIRNGWKTLKERIRKVPRAYRRLRKRKDEFLEFWNLEAHRNARAALWKEARYLWKKLRPGKIRGRVEFGLEDPAATGLCMGAAGMLCAWYPKGLAIVPDFEREVLKVDIQIRGKARLYVAARVLWRVYFNKEIRRMYQHWQEL